MTLDDDKARSRILSERIRQRADVKAMHLVEEFAGTLDYTAKEDLMISQAAWRHLTESDIRPHRVFAHPDMLQKHPETSLYYRGIALLSLKRVRQRAADVKPWETKARTRPVPRESALAVCRLYNSVISSIIEGTSRWTLENGYRNILGNMGITFDGMLRNLIGQDAEELIKTRITEWLEDRQLIIDREDKNRFSLPKGTTMVYGSEPDILFLRDDSQLATVEIKGGKDPAGALERLGAMQKSFTETPARCQNFLVAGVITAEMQSRLDQIAVKVFVLDDLLNDDGWQEFTNELFHHTLRIL